MFDAGDRHSSQDSDSGTENSFGSGRTEGRRQYTLKGVETEAIDLMREAASVDGMKIGHWVSDRIKEAALMALKDAERRRVTLEAVAGRYEREDLPFDHYPCKSEDDPASDSARIARLELEVRELTRVQRDLLAHAVASRR